MRIGSLKRRKGTEKNKKINKAYNKMQSLIEALNTKEIPSPGLISINERIELINSFSGTDKELIRFLNTTYRFILTFIEKNLNLVPKHHFMARWMFYGTITGVVLTSIVSNFDFMGIDGLASIILPMAVAAGIIIGKFMDDIAKKEDRQIDLEAADA